MNKHLTYVAMGLLVGIMWKAGFHSVAVGFSVWVFCLGIDYLDR